MAAGWHGVGKGNLSTTTSNGSDPEPMLATTPETTRALETDLMTAFQRSRGSVAFEELYAASAPGLLRWIEQCPAVRAHGVDPLEALQDTFVNVYRYVGSFRPDAPGGFRAWARTIAANVVRRARRRPVSAGVPFSDAPAALDAPADRRSSPSARAADAEDSTELRGAYALLLLHYAAAFDQLKERDRQALQMVEVEGVGYAEVGRRLGVGRSNTKMIVFRARQRLRAQLSRTLDTAEAGNELPAVARCA